MGLWIFGFVVVDMALLWIRGDAGDLQKMVSTVISMGEDPTQLCLRGIVIDLA